MTAASKAPNAAQIDHWNATTGLTWAEWHEVLDQQLAPLGQAAIEALRPQSGEHILDIGCGCGQTSVQLAERVGPAGAVVGVDISQPMLQVARGRALPENAARPEFRECDVQVAEFGPGAFDAVFSRFGVMFFADPVAAFANVASALKPGGRLAFVCWRSLQLNPWMRSPFEAAEHLLPPRPPADPLDPGPFAFADQNRVRKLLTDACFHTIAIEPCDAMIGGFPIETALGLALKVGPLGSAVRQNPELREAVSAVVSEVLRQYQLPDGTVRMPSAVWIVSAQR